MSVLYSSEILAAAVELAAYPALATFDCEGTARSQTCGSQITIQCAVTPDQRIARIGLIVHACAIGQASAALFARHAVGMSAQQLEQHRAHIAGWLGGEASLPDWPDFGLIAVAGDYPARHSAILLPWMAASEALSSAPASR